ncbi:sulfatase family protein [Catalinimonas niigatensis]|uniref:sulfatase family protein n=1 Tax=Catalinimonas niigatensis TaxID=1397264 RepID=UPI002666954D|nr:sulfatase [Catalinimonas niigatensis]WPP52686.1 sulfatase [Catalinimonas niigatensis]
MTYRYLFFALFVCLAVSCTKNAATTETEDSTAPQSPNVVIIFTDDQGYQDVGTFGSPNIKTPNLDQMAREGLKLTDFYAAQAVCSASRAALFTGCYPNRLGIHGALMPDSKIALAPSETTIAEMLKTKGYITAAYGKWHLGDKPEYMPNQQGFDDYFGIPYSNDMWPLHPQQGSVHQFGPLPLYDNAQVIDTLEDQSMLTTQITERSVQFIEDHKDQPFFLYVAHPQPHVPLFVSDKFKGKSERGLYGDVIMEIDWSVGQILETLKQNGLDENTLVIFTSDNGPWLSYGEHAGSALPLREGKGTALEGGQREPCIIRYPGKLEAGKVIDVPLMTIDILPTLAALTGAELPEKKIDGKNMWPVLTGESADSPHEAYFFYYKVNELHGVRYGDWKLYFPHTYRSLNGRKGRNDGLPVDYEQLSFDQIELYNLREDISETNNVAAEHPEIVEKIKTLADEMRQELGDKLTGTEGTEVRPAASVEG